MKTTVLLCALVAVALVWVRNWQLVRARDDVSVARAALRIVEEQRVPKAELDRARSTAETAEQKSAALERELAATREQLVAFQEKARAAELRKSQPPAAGPGTPAAPLTSSPNLLKGTYTTMEDTLVYSPDAELKIGDDILISSPTGMMLSDREVALVAGDLAVETPSGKMQATHAFIDVNKGKIDMTADSMTFSSR